MEYEWDPAKNRSNFAKHGFDFEDAEIVFEGPCSTFEDHRFDYGETRLIPMGFLAGRLVVITHSEREESTHIISRHEQNIYQERLGKN
jgi:uncharacterized DUF497 family protein